jgi:hypothetical protein
MEEEKNKYENAIMEHKQLFEREIKFVNKKLYELSNEKTRQ